MFRKHNEQMDRKKKYLSYLLRLWVDDANGEQVWRISLEHPLSGERRGFASLDDLCAHLAMMMHRKSENQEVSDE
jgi:hypothetical protein